MSKRTTTIFLCIFGFLVSSTAQSVRESRLNVLDVDRMAYSIEFNLDQKVVQDAWNKKCDELSIKDKPSKGLDVYAAVLVPDIHFESVDIYTKIDKLDKTRSTFSITVSKGNTNFMSTEEAKLVGNVKTFLEKFITYAEQYKLGLDIAAQEGNIKDTQKVYDKLVEDGKKLQAEMDENKLDQANKVKELEALNKGLEELKLKVKK
jgi:hypothetical protein